MKKSYLINFLILFVLLGQSLKAQDLETPEKTLSPYFLVNSDSEEGTDIMPLKATSADVNIAGVIADVTIKQVYVNEGNKTLEAIYVFPGSTQAAVYGMTMTIGERRLVAKIEEKGKAREQYEQAKTEGKTVSLLEQERPNVFQMNVANILPGDSITVELRYTELLVPEEGVYEFAYPAVVGPRYSNTPKDQAQANEQWVENPYLKEGVDAPYDFNISTNLNAGMPIQDIFCPSHETLINYTNKNSAQVLLDPKGGNGGNKDFVLRYRLTGGKIQSGLLLYEGNQVFASGTQSTENANNEKFFLLMMQPPKAVTTTEIPPREYIFIIDVSGSMHGFPINTAKAVLKELISKLRPEDRFNVMLFESSNSMLSPESMEATEENINKALKVIDKQGGSGGTNLLPALKKALAFKETKDYSRTFVVVTDGYVTVEKEAFDLIRENLNEANLFAFGIGSSVNRYLIERMANAGMGEPFIILNENEAKVKAEKFRQYIANPVLTNIKIEYDGFEVYDLEPLSVPDVFAERPIIVYGKYKGDPTGTITLTGLSGKKKYKTSIEINEAETQNNQALRYLWARKRIQILSDYAPYTDTKAEVTALGLKYNLLTEFTSFIAIDDEVRNENGESTTVKQPLPLPDGVTNLAVAGGVTTMYSQDMTYAPAPAYNRRSGKKTKPKKGNYNQPTLTANEVRDGIYLEEVEEKTKEVDKKDIAKTDASPIQGMKKFLKWLKGEIQYPEEAKNQGIEGTVMVEFTVNADGTLSNFNIIQSLGYGCDEEAIRVLKTSLWNPAVQGNQMTSSIVQVPVEFKIK